MSKVSKNPSNIKSNKSKQSFQTPFCVSCARLGESARCYGFQCPHVNIPSSCYKCPPILDGYDCWECFGMGRPSYFDVVEGRS